MANTSKTLIYLISLFNSAVYQGGHGLHPVRRQRVQSDPPAPPTHHQGHHTVREQVRLGCDDQLREGRAAWPSRIGLDTPYRYTQEVAQCV